MWFILAVATLACHSPRACGGGIGLASIGGHPLVRAATVSTRFALDAASESADELFWEVLQPANTINMVNNAAARTKKRHFICFIGESITHKKVTGKFL